MPFRTSPVVAEDEWQLRLEVENGIGVLTLDRPDKLNAWSWEASRQLGARADQIRFDDRIRVVVVKAEGRAFCAGVDLGMPEDRVTGRSPAEKVRNYYEGIRWVHERFRVFSELPQPIVCAVHGYCLGFGFELALMCDVRLCCRRRRLRPARGLGGGGRRRRRGPAAGPRGRGGVGQAPGAAPAAGSTPPPPSAWAWSSRSPRRDELVPTAMALAAEIAANAPLAVQSIKRTIDVFAYRGMAEALKFESLSASVEFVSDDMPAGYAAKAQRQPVRFEGK